MPTELWLFGSDGQGPPVTSDGNQSPPSQRNAHPPTHGHNFDEVSADRSKYIFQDTSPYVVKIYTLSNC